MSLPFPAPKHRCPVCGHVDCRCGVDPTCCSPFAPRFVRLRYFFGQRLGVVDLTDEQSYHVGKRRLHNRSLHGSGVVCGLRAERFIWPQGSPADTPTTVLRVSHGIAVDACGRDIVVGSDQCIDVGAWFLVNRERPEIVEWAESDEPRKLWVAVRYRDCPSDPSPAPRDPCGCDEGGCEFGRVREAFELRLLTEAERTACACAPFPTLAELRGALAASGAAPGGCDGLRDALGELVAASCPEPPDDFWLCLACVTVELDEDITEVVDLPAVDSAIPERCSLLSSQALQALLTESLCAGAAGGAFAPGPAISAATFAGNAGEVDSGTLRLAVALRDDPASPGTAIPLAEATFAAGAVDVQSFDPAAGWSAVAPSAVAYDPSDPPGIDVAWASGSGLAAGRYRITLDAPGTTPIVDERMGALAPSPFVFQFRLEEQDGTLVLAETLF